MLEAAKGREFRGRAVRWASDVVSGLTVNMDSRKRLGGVPVQSSGNAVRPNGDVPVRASGRYMQPSLVFATGAEWTYVNAIDFVQARSEEHTSELQSLMRISYAVFCLKKKKKKNKKRVYHI